MFSNHYFQKQVLLRLGDVITGQKVYASLNFLQKSEFWKRDEIYAFQLQRLKLLIQHAYEYVPYYKELFRNLHLVPDDIKTKEDLNKIPILTKVIIKQEGIERFTSKAFQKSKLMQASSSGSTGEPLFYFNTKEAYSMNIAANLRGWYGMGYKLGDKYIKLSQNPRKSPVKRIQDTLTNNLYLATNPLTKENFKYILEQIEIYQPKIIRCYPDPLLFIARYKKEHPEFTYIPHALTTTGNTLFPETRQEIEEAFGCKIFDAYSCEGNACVFECPTHDCYHSTEEYGITEIIDENGNAIKKGIGRLISTDLWNVAHPFIRYDTQDLVEIDDTPCICGRQHLRINQIIGRDNEVLLMPSGRKFIVHNFTGFFQTDAKAMKRAVDQFQIIKQKDNSVLFKLVVNAAYDKEVEMYILDFWQKELGVPVYIEIVKEISIMQNNKRRFIIND